MLHEGSVQFTAVSGVVAMLPEAGSDGVPGLTNMLLAAGVTTEKVDAIVVTRSDPLGNSFAWTQGYGQRLESKNYCHI